MIWEIGMGDERRLNEVRRGEARDGIGRDEIIYIIKIIKDALFGRKCVY